MSCTEIVVEVENLVDNIITKQDEVQKYKTQINNLYTLLSTKLQENHSVVSKEIEGIYKDIESLFNKKSTVEINIHQMKQELNNTFGIQ